MGWEDGMTEIDTSHDIATPASSGSLLSGPTVLALGARIAARIAAGFGDPIRFGETVIVARHANVLEVLHRDLDFLIAPINETRIDEVNGPFVLGMDRSATLVRERGALYQALTKVDLAPIRHAAEEEAKTRIAGAGREIDVVDAYARPIAAHTATSLFGIKGPDEPRSWMPCVRSSGTCS